MVPISIIKTPTMFKMILIVSVPASLVRTSSGYGPHFRQHLRLLKHGLRRLLLFVGRISFPASAESVARYASDDGPEITMKTLPLDLLRRAIGSTDKSPNA